MKSILFSDHKVWICILGFKTVCVSTLGFRVKSLSLHTPLGLTPPHPLAKHPPWSTPPGQTPPSLRYYGIRSTSGRYWNAYLFGLFLPENCMKLKKKVGSRRGTSLVPPLGPPLLKILTKNRISTTLHGGSCTPVFSRAVVNSIAL